MKKNRFISILACGAALGLQGAVLQWDFGNGGAYVGTNTPGHVAGDVLAGDNTFTQVGSGDSANVAGSGYSIDWGRNQSGTSENRIQWSNAMTNVSGAAGSDIFSTSLTTDGVSSSTHNTSNIRSPVGLRIGGLADGLYRAYIVVNNTSVDGLAETKVYAGAATLTTPNNMTGISATLGLTDLGNVSGATSANWVANSNYVTTEFTINTAGGDDGFYVLSDSSVGGLTRVHTSITALQIVAVPEPNSLVLIGLAFGGLMLLKRRRYMHS